ncbi:LysR family transcriptional regulator [Roseovarius pacificus]|uniref:LysR family transcriptional regulator n=1 Tax=Roseovarius pacificus TaxID=337701 RepID=UPI00296905A8|nr:LysR family transcriptional regulator [Roseovarius pacificus]
MNGLRRKLPSSGSLFVFEAAARHQNFTRAADELNVTQPAVSRSLAALEAHLGARLFLRGKLGAQLTEDGVMLKNAIVSAFSQIEDALREVEARRTGKSQVTLSVSTAFTTHWLMPRISRFQAAFPEVDLRFQLISGAVAGPLGDVDLAMRYCAPGDEQGRFVMQEAYVPVAAPGYEEALGEGELPALIQLEGNEWNRLPGAEGWTSGDPEPQLSFSDYSVVVQAALVGQGVAAGWLNVVAHWICENRLCPAENSGLVRPGRVCRLIQRHDGPQVDIVERVAEWLVHELREDVARMHRQYPKLGIGALLDPVQSEGNRT